MLTRRALLAATAASLAPGLRRAVARSLGPARPRPTADQLTWQRDERALFLHFGINTFTDREWGDGREDPVLFNPTALDAGQWAQTARAAGFRALILTAKHHDGFCLWPTRTTRHSVAASPWRGGHGDVVREFVDACRAERLGVGLYLSPWDRHDPTYGDSPRYNDVYAAQLTELLTHYGPLTEVWFDGANGEGPNGRKQTYDWPRVWGLVRRLQPHAVIFSDAGPDVRWIGNERGLAGDPNWSMVDPAAVPFPGASGPEVTAMLQHGDPSGAVWRPGETDVSIRPGWFHHEAETAQVRSVENLVGLYCTSVGRNSKFLLNVPPTRTGRLDEVDVGRLKAFGDELRLMFAEDLTKHCLRAWGRPSADTFGVELDLGLARPIGLARLTEDITRGQWVAGYALEGATDTDWRLLARGTTIGYCRLDRFPSANVRHVRLTVTGLPDQALAEHSVQIALFAGGSA